MEQEKKNFLERNVQEFLNLTDDDMRELDRRLLDACDNAISAILTFIFVVIPSVLSALVLTLISIALVRYTFPLIKNMLIFLFNVMNEKFFYDMVMKEKIGWSLFFLVLTALFLYTSWVKFNNI